MVELTPEENKQLCEKYPFLLPHNRWTDEVPKNFDYSYTELDAMPDGWREAFGLQMCNELKEALEKIDKINEFRIEQIKEKFGELRFYTNWVNDEIINIINKYEALSRKTCICCGKPATKITTDWISPYCDECIDKENDTYIDINEYYE